MVAEEIEKLERKLPEGVCLVAVSKFHPAQMIMEAYDAGQRRFGESRVQELLEKIPVLPEDIEWHFIGHLQTNKVRHLIGKVALIESVDSIKLLELIDSESRKADVVTRVLMQVHVAQEETKFGFLPEEMFSYFGGNQYEKLTNTRICGVMGMASNTDDMQRVRSDFAAIADIYNQIRDNRESGLEDFNILSMGMSHDWPLAVEEGANLIRVGTRIFGERQY